MAAFCGSCGKPVAPDGQFCGACGAPNSASVATASMAPAAAKSSSALKILVVILLAGVVAIAAAGVGAFYFGRKKIAQWRNDHPDVVATVNAAAASVSHSTSQAANGSPFLSKEEVSEIIGRPVTEIVMSGRSDATYKTATPGFEAAIEVDRRHNDADATQDIEGARTVTKRMAGGTGESVAGLGDDALYGAFNVLYIRKNDVVLMVTPPNLQMAAQQELAHDMFSKPMGSDDQVKALEKLKDSMKGDPIAGSMSQPDATSGAVNVIQHSAADRGNEYETKARLMARQLAEKVLSKI